MTSTYVSYRLFARDMDRSLALTEANPINARDAQYYRDNIGKVTSIDDFLDNHRLYSYAMKAHGMDDMMYAKAFMRKVLESDLSDEDSFAMKLVDQRYRTFAEAFNFDTDGTVKGEAPRMQASYQEDALIGLYSEHRVRQGTVAAAESKYYREEIAGVASVDAFLANDRLFAYALTAVGIDHTIASKAAIRDALVSDPLDPDGAAARLGTKYQTLALAFDFAADGSVPAGGAQSEASVEEMAMRYYEMSGNGASLAAASLKADYYAEVMPEITDVDTFLNDGRLVEVALNAFGLSPTSVTRATIRAVLTSDLSDPDSVANILNDPRYPALAGAFNFKPDGTTDGAAQSPEQIESTFVRYFANYDDVAEGIDAVATTYYRSKIDTIVSVDTLMQDPQLYNYVLKAFGFDPALEEPSFIRSVLTSDPTDPNSFANIQLDKRYAELAAAFNFSADGSVAMPRIAQLDDDKLAIIKLYNTRTGPDAGPIEQQTAKDENTYYNDTIGGIGTVDELLEDDRLVAYLVKAFDLGEEQVTKEVLRDVLTSDPFDKESVANEMENKGFRDLAAAFNFDADGNAARAPEAQAQYRSDIIRTADLFLRLSMETAAGEENPGVRLALYFQRKASIIDSPFDILADKALYEVVRTALGLPDLVATASTDIQASMLEKRLNLEDFQDPAKVERFLAQFSVFYDAKNSGSSAASTVSALFRRPAS